MYWLYREETPSRRADAVKVEIAEPTVTITLEQLTRSYAAAQDAARVSERHLIAAYVEAQLLGAGRDAFDVVLKPSLVRAVAEDIREGRYQ